MSMPSTKRPMINTGEACIPESETMSLNAVVRVARTSSSLDAFLHSSSASAFDVAIRGHRRRLIMPFISVVTWNSRDLLNIS
ncbi:unnamed protein product [Hymenolepis diminuta]|uniref:Uncharacterized protein n=1 Tax=Hymenolepis diminuta TaxID=6216 RepID=A0A0R3SY41_HYMDI|nr:unnamed protein product [Hymenolepis diminuta]